MPGIFDKLLNRPSGPKEQAPPPLEVITSIRTLTIPAGETSASDHFDFRSTAPWRSTLGALDCTNLSTEGTLVLRVNDGPVTSLDPAQTQRGLVSIVPAGLDGDSYRGHHIRTLGVFFQLGRQVAVATNIAYSLRGWARS